jgi:hypothetical protein
MENEDPFIRFLREDAALSAAEKAQSVLARIERRFGAVGPQQRKRVLGASLAELRDLETRLSDAQSLREVWS